MQTFTSTPVLSAVWFSVGSVIALGCDYLRRHNTKKRLQRFKQVISCFSVQDWISRLWPHFLTALAWSVILTSAAILLALIGADIVLDPSKQEVLHEVLSSPFSVSIALLFCTISAALVAGFQNVILIHRKQEKECKERDTLRSDLKKSHQEMTEIRRKLRAHSNVIQDLENLFEDARGETFTSEEVLEKIELCKKKHNHR